MGGDCGWQRGEALEPQRRVQPQGCRVQSREIPAQRLGTEQHSPAREACLLTRRGGWGLGAEAPALEVRSQREDWGWLREHSLKGASVPQLARSVSTRRSGAAEEARDYSLPLSFVVHEERGFRATTKQAPEMGASRSYQRDTRDGHEMLSLLLQAPRSLCASTSHYPHLPSWEPV